MQTQKKLSEYFQLTVSYNDKKTCFIYDPLNKKAFFASSPFPKDIFVIKKCGLQMFYRDSILSSPYPIPHVSSDATIPLLKSNLQKAIRRCHTDIACESALAIFRKSPVELMRRLGVIYIEDVCLQDSYSIVIWWMITDTFYKYSIYDQSLLISIIVSLCNCHTTCDREFISTTKENVNELEDDAVIALYYRQLYGGMKGDMEMLRHAIGYYKKYPEKIVKTDYDIPWPTMNSETGILEEAIDFHPFPCMLNILAKKTGLEPAQIRDAIWNAESSLNVRKKTTEYDIDAWKRISEYITEVRYLVLQ
jgi:hypothetical protein